MQNLSRDNVVFLIPCLNEQESIKLVLDEIKNLNIPCRVIVIDNNSDDDTVKIARSQNAEVLVENKRGKGYAFLKGLNALNNEQVIILIDGDYTYDLSNLKNVLNIFENYSYDIAIGNRIYPNNQKVSRIGHKTFNSFFSNLFNFIFKVEIKDSLSGFRVMSNSFLKDFNLYKKEFELEILLNYHAAINRANVYNFPCNYRSRLENSKSKLRTFKDARKLLTLFFELFINFKAGQFFGGLSFFVLILSMFALQYNFLYSLNLIILAANLALSGSIIKRLTRIKI